MKAMELHTIDTKIGFIVGMTGGMLKYISGALLDISFAGRLVEAGLTAMVCGFLGVAGKHTFYWLRKKYFTKKNKT